MPTSQYWTYLGKGKVHRKRGTKTIHIDLKRKTLIATLK